MCMDIRMFPFHVCSRLVQRWVDYMLGALIVASPELQQKAIPLLDNLTCQLLALCKLLYTMYTFTLCVHTYICTCLHISARFML